jgi:DNA-binding transcriptional regulator YiaG
MRKVEAVRIRYGMTKIELAAELGANVDGVRAWMTGRTIGRKETVAKIEDFLKRKSV